MTYRIVSKGWPTNAASRKAAELASQIDALLRGPSTLFLLCQAALLIVVDGRPGRVAFEALLGEKIPNSLWQELKELAKSAHKTPASELDDLSADELAVVVGSVALACVTARSGGRLRLDKRLERPLTDTEWSSLQAHVAKELPRFQRTWQRSRKMGGLTLPSSLRTL